MSANQAVILGGTVRTQYIWECADCRSVYKDFDFKKLDGCAHLHHLQQHGPLDGQESFGFEVPRRKPEDTT